MSPRLRNALVDGLRVYCGGSAVFLGGILLSTQVQFYRTDPAMNQHPLIMLCMAAVSLGSVGAGLVIVKPKVRT